MPEILDRDAPAFRGGFLMFLANMRNPLPSRGVVRSGLSLTVRDQARAPMPISSGASPVIVATSRSPGTTGPTPEGVPVKITSPGSRA